MLFILRSRELPEPQASHGRHEQSHVQMAIESCKYNALFPGSPLWPHRTSGMEVPGVLTKCAPHISRVLLFSFCDMVSHWSSGWPQICSDIA